MPGLFAKGLYVELNLSTEIRNYPKLDWCTHMSNVKKKPFPWQCCNCGRKTMYGAVLNYVGTAHHYLDKYVIRIDGLATPKCVNCGKVTLDGEALEAISVELRRQANLLTPEQIREHRLKANLTQQQLAASLGFIDAEVDRWEQGIQMQTRSQDNLIRVFFKFDFVREFLAKEQATPLVPEAVA